MKKVAKVVIIDDKNKYLLMIRSAHPVFQNDPDLAGGTVEDGEDVREAAAREVFEEAGVTLDAAVLKELYAGTEYSTHHTEYHLYEARLESRPEIVISWEHGSYEWLDRDEFMQKSRDANDTYMHMVYEVLKGQE